MQVKAMTLSQDTLNKSAQAFDEKLRHFGVSLSTLLTSNEFKEMARASENGEKGTYFRHYSSLQVPFMQLRLIEPFIRSVLVTSPIGEFYSTHNVRVQQDTDKSSDIYRKMMQEQRSFWIGGHEDPFFTDHDRVISLVLIGIANDDPHQDVNVIANFSESELQDFLFENAIDYREGVAWIGPDGQLLMAQPYFQYKDMVQSSAILEKIKLGAGSFDVQHNGDELLINFQHSKVIKDWTLISIKPRSEVLKELRNIQWIVITATLASAVLALILSNLLAQYLSGPLIKLQRLMRAAGSHSDLNVRFKSPYRDEISQVGNQFNQMLEQISMLIQEIKDVENEKRRAEIKALQAQIDPHFLYNTLNTIYWKAGSQRTKDVMQMVMSLSKLFKLGLNNGQEWTTLEKELQHVEHYLNLQVLCYEELFAYEIHIEDRSLLSLMIPKIIIQPLVENSILHGFKNREKGGYIYIRVERGHQELCLEVRDNGCGIDVEQVQAGIYMESTNGSFALRNVFQRLQLCYGEMARIHFTSDGGTSIRIRIPLSNLSE
ncbi:sensor histidine kinase [Paenibacillus sp. YYML68]|uniref:cache domain-containing sensor histidine kinase n=1 Tax=Paenibacillus sp. YYML68 TaxID=2909250 RepID=UPI00249247EA|nr:histidine kinase [Paenibacillus sp. YYML68]